MEVTVTEETKVPFDRERSLPILVGIQSVERRRQSFECLESERKDSTISLELHWSNWIGAPVAPVHFIEGSLNTPQGFRTTRELFAFSSD